MAEPNLYLGWVDSDGLEDVPDGPWTDGFVLRPGLLLLRSPHTRSDVYHALKYAVPAGRSVLVAPLADAPKFKGMTAGAAAWLRARD